MHNSQSESVLWKYDNCSCFILVLVKQTGVTGEISLGLFSETEV